MSFVNLEPFWGSPSTCMRFYSALVLGTMSAIMSNGVRVWFIIQLWWVCVTGITSMNMNGVYDSHE
jgi:hypothetical protein